MKLLGKNLSGGSSIRGRVKDDYYATPESSVLAILEREPLQGSILEPACGEGHISKVLFDKYPNSEIVSTDIVKREDKFSLGIVGGIDFLTHNFGRVFDNVITNPLFSISKEFVEKALKISKVTKESY